MTDPIDHILDRITFDPKAQMSASAIHHPSQLRPVPWPTVDGLSLEPIQVGIPAPIPGPLGEVDAVIVTWTSAEWQALTDVLGPLAPEFPYANDYDSYLPDLTSRSPAKDAKCLARVRRVNCGNGKTVLLVHSMLHLATDGVNLPLRRLIDQIIDETLCSRIITTGTAGGIGPDKMLGDVVLGENCRFDCKKTFATSPFAQTSYPTTGTGFSEALPPETTMAVLAANIDQLASQRTTKPGEVVAPGVVMPIQVIAADIITTDFFAFDTSDDHFGLQKYDNFQAGVVEMDDAVFGLVMQDRAVAGKYVMPKWSAVRNCSDPQADMTKYATEEDAATAMGLIYRRWGYWTTVPSAIVSWLLAVT